MADEHSGLHVIEKFSNLTDIQYIDSGTLIAIIPAGYPPDTYNLHVTNPDTGHSVLHNAFSVHEGYSNDPPKFDHIGDKTINEGDTLRFAITAIDPDMDDLTFAAIDLPFKANFVSNTQELSWIPAYNQSGSYKVTFTVTDDGIPPLSDSETITITFLNKFTEPSWTWDPKRYQYRYHFPHQNGQLWNYKSIHFTPFPLQSERLRQNPYQRLFLYLQQIWHQTYFINSYMTYGNYF